MKRQYYVIGDPIEHSLSPSIHLPILRRYFCDVSYDIKNVKTNELAEFLRFVRANKISGFNITMPHKSTIIPLLDSVSDSAKALSSVNTVINENGILKGYSTDGEGLIRAFSEEGFAIEGRNILILGAGGASNTVAVAMAQRAAKSITVLARDVEKAKKVVGLAKKANAKVILSADSMTEANLAIRARDTDILINATSLGMQGVESQFENFNFLDSLNKNAIVYDLIYKPKETLLLKNAKERSFRTMNGLGMLIHQAIISDEYYIGNKLPLQKTKKEIEKALNALDGIDTI